ncbi:hypothetical protein FOA52_012924 [Chlamydomonas sp. UWO 241]|nr:hypothetical protein FOA52_012924 [Chlamydomonas sp. UWO 241]
MAFTLSVQTGSGRDIAKLEVSGDETVREVKKKLYASKKGPDPNRCRFTLLPPAGEKRGKVLDDDKTIGEYGLAQGSAVLFKDLGPQIGYSTVFFWEYFGPLVVYPLFFLFPRVLYPWHKEPVEHSLVQLAAVAYWSFHYTKRIVETFTVHRFGHATMPIFNLFKNCAYYWGFAAFVSYFVNHPMYTSPPDKQWQAALALAMVCQLSNLYCHIILSNLRAPGDKGYMIPRGFLFNYITCANYSAEIWGWALFSVATQCLPAGLFMLAGAGQMAVWAQAKHARLKKLFDGKEGRAKYPRRYGWKGPVNSALQGMILAAVGDVLAQYLTQGTTQPDEQPAAAGAASSAAFLGERYDPVRTLRLAGFGTWWGVMQWYWYNLLDHVQPSKSAVAIAKKVAANQLCLAPIGCFSVFAWMLWFAGRINELPAKLERDFLPTLVSCWAFWVPVASLNFRLVPLASQVGFMNSAGVLWNCYLSLAAADAAGDGLECACAVPHATPVAARA